MDRFERIEQRIAALEEKQKTREPKRDDPLVGMPESQLWTQAIGGSGIALAALQEAHPELLIERNAVTPSVLLVTTAKR